MSTHNTSNVTPLPFHQHADKRIVLLPMEVSDLLSQFREVVRDEIEATQKLQLGEKLLSPAETCKLFQPEISKVTLNAWTKDGRLQDYRIGGRVFYKYSEIMSSLQTLKKYKKSV